MMSLIQFTALTQYFVLKKRALSTGEQDLARQIFGQQLKLENIQIVAHRLVLKDYAVSPNGHIYFHPENWCEDFSTQNLSIQSWLIHELTHVWQIQQGISVIRKALFDRRYAYVLIAGKQFLDYGIEQQAQMVQDYFIKSRSGQQCADLAHCIPFLQQHISH